MRASHVHSGSESAGGESHPSTEEILTASQRCPAGFGVGVPQHGFIAIDPESLFRLVRIPAATTRPLRPDRAGSSLPPSSRSREPR